MDNETTKNLVAAVRERDRRIEDLAQALVDQAAALDAALDAALASERAAIRARIRARVGALRTTWAMEPHGDTTVKVDWTRVDDVLAAIGGAS